MNELGVHVPEQAHFDVVGFGLNAVDHLCVVDEFPRPDTKPRVRAFARAPGGQAASAMVVCARLGLKAKYVGKVGGDETGAFSLESIRSEGVDVSDVGIVPGATNQLAMIIVDRSRGERTILWYRPNEIATRPNEVTPEKVAVGRVLLIDGHDADASAAAARIARERGVPVVLDAESVKDGTGDVVANTDILIASREFPERFTGNTGLDAAMSAVSESGPRVVCVTLGREGAVLRLVDGTTITSPGFDVAVEDTTGAGDVFHGAFVYGLLAAWPAARILDFANAAAALCCTELGARGGARRMEEIEDLMRRDGRL